MEKTKALQYCFDIDGTLCSNTEGAYEDAEVFPGMVARVNALYDSGCTISLHTARGSTTHIDWRELTERQLSEWGVRYHALFMGKPTADIYVDDKAVNVRDWNEQWDRTRFGRGVKTALVAVADGPSVLDSSVYLDVTYHPKRVPYGKYPAQLGQWLLENVYRKSGRLLDLGCGRGEYLAVFADLGFEVAGVDISPSAPKLVGSGFQVKVADVEKVDIPYPRESFDFIFSKSVIEHMRNPVVVLARAHAALKPGGVAVIMTPSWRHSYWGPFYIDHTHVTPFTAPSLEDVLRFSGFEEISVANFRQLPFLWKFPRLTPLVSLFSVLPLPYRPMNSVSWPDGVNKLIRFSKEVMLLAVARKSIKQ